MKYFIDTEFIEGFHKPLFGKRRHYIDLISIGVVAEDGREYYAISSEYNFKDASSWVKQCVIEPLYYDTIHGDARNFLEVDNYHKRFGKTNKQIAKEVKEFCKPQRLFEIDKPIKINYSEIKNPEFYGYYADYDWVLFCSLFGRMMDLPKGFPMYCKDLKQMFDEKANSYTSEQLSKIEYPTVSHNVLEYLESSGKIDKPIHLKTHKDYPIQENEHNALDDARWNKKLFDFINGL